MIIVPELQVVVITPPRTASSALKNEICTRWAQAMPLYRHRERDGIPPGYDRWPVVGLMRHPLRRLLSFYYYMRKIPRSPTTKEGALWIADCANDTNRPFKNWLLESRHAFHTPWTHHPKYDMVRYTASTRRSLRDYYLPEQLDLTLFRMEYDMQRVRRYFDIPLVVQQNTASYDPVAEYNKYIMDAEVVAFLKEFHAYDLAFYPTEGIKV